MIYTVSDSEIFIPNHPDFNAQQTIESGQLFRYKQTSFGYEVYSLNHRAVVYCQKDGTRIVCDDVKYFINYFDLDTNYAKIKLQLQSDELLMRAMAVGNGIRILKQDRLEAIIAFIISANNNIPRIKQIFNDICQHYGTDMGGYHAFPTLQQLSNIPLSFFKEIKSGYRAQYLFDTIAAIAGGFDLNEITTLNVNDGVKRLCTLSGVGPKVADCILLYGYYITHCFPTDTWLVKVYYDYFPEKTNVPVKEIRQYFMDKFGKLSGFAQQYLFYYKRN